MRQLFAVAVAVATVACASAASAAGPSAAVLVGNGFKGDPNLYGIGIGVRGGVTLPVLPLYIGGTFMYHLGTTVGEIKTNVFYLGPEVGYELSLGPATIRPYLGVGYASARSSGSFCFGGLGCTDVSNSEGKIAFWPGVTGLVGVGPVFVGADLRYTVITDVPDGNGNAFGAFATLGMGF
jgi:hypothetical protein